MNTIIRKMITFVTEAVRKEIEALDPDCPCAKEMSKLDDVGNTIAKEVEKLYNAATLREVSKTLLLVGRLKKAPVQEREAIERELERINEDLVRRVETESGQLRLPKACHHLFLGL